MSGNVPSVPDFPISTCNGGQVCGSAHYYEQGTYEDNIIAPVLFAGIAGGIKAGFRGIVEGIFGGAAKTGLEDTTATTFQDILQGAVNDASGQPTKSGGFAQATKDFDALAGKAQSLGKVQMKELPDGGKAVLRNFSNDGRATLEYQPPTGGSKTAWIRYNQ